MNKLILLTMVFSLSTLTIQANIIFVRQGKFGTGVSWSDATGNLQDALEMAQSGDEIWVAEGTYYPTDDGDRTKTFTIPNNVKLIGGFEGTELSRFQRNHQKNKTILSGDIAVEGNPFDNSYNVVSIIHTGPNTLFDGFIVADGMANNPVESGNPTRCGGGLYVKNASPTIQNCTFQNNYGEDGGAVYNNGIGGQCNPNFVNCTFKYNKADLDGGAVFNDGRRGGQCNPVFRACSFVDNEGNYGGGICNYGGGGESSPTLIGCTFRGNKASRRGGGIFNMDLDGTAKPTLTHCRFVDNEAIAGKGVYNFSSQKEKNTFLTNNIKAD